MKRKIKYTALDSRPQVQGPRLEVRPENNTVGDVQVLIGNSVKISWSNGFPFLGCLDIVGGDSKPVRNVGKCVYINIELYTRKNLNQTGPSEGST